MHFWLTGLCITMHILIFMGMHMKILQNRLYVLYLLSHPMVYYLSVVLLNSEEKIIIVRKGIVFFTCMICQWHNSQDYICNKYGLQIRIRKFTLCSKPKLNELHHCWFRIEFILCYIKVCGKNIFSIIFDFLKST